MKTWAPPWSCSTWRPSAPGLRKGVSPSLSCLPQTQKRRSQRPWTCSARGLQCSRQNQTPSRAKIYLNPPGAAGTVCTMTSTPTTPTNAKNSAPCEKEGSAVVLTVLTGATTEEEEETQDAGKTAARAKGGVINLARTAGGPCLAGGRGGISLVRIACRATQASLHCRR